MPIKHSVITALAFSLVGSPSDMARVGRLDVENIMSPDEIPAVTGRDQQILDAAVDSSGVVLQHDQLWRERRQVATL